MLITVNAIDMKRIFTDIKPICKSVDIKPLMAFTVHDDMLTITVKSAVVYEYKLEVAERGPYNLTVLYQDLAELIPTRDTVEIDLEPTYVHVHTDAISVVLQQSYGVISEYKPRHGAPKPINAESLSSVINIFAETSPMSKTLGRTSPIVFTDECSIMKFSTFWLQAPAIGLTGVVSLEDMKAIEKFAPERVNCTKDALEFYRVPAVMAITSNEPAPVKSVEDMRSEGKEKGYVQGFYYLPKIQQLLRSVGPGTCRLGLYCDGIQITVARPSVQSSMKIGKCSGTPLMAFDTFLEYVQMFWRLLGNESVQVVRGERWVCLSNQRVMLLLATV